MSVPADEAARLAEENAELRARVERAEREIAQLRDEALARRDEIRALTDDIPAAMSRRVLLAGMARDLRHHPDKARVSWLGVRKIDRTLRQAWKSLADRSGAH